MTPASPSKRPTGAPRLQRMTHSPSSPLSRPSGLGSVGIDQSNLIPSVATKDERVPGARGVEETKTTAPSADIGVGDHVQVEETGDSDEETRGSNDRVMIRGHSFSTKKPARRSTINVFGAAADEEQGEAAAAPGGQGVVGEAMEFINTIKTLGICGVNFQFNSDL